jgi:hypothetical protein
MLTLVWSHWSSTFLLYSAVINICLLTIGKMNSTDIDSINLVDNYHGLQSQVFLRTIVAIPVIIGLRGENLYLPWLGAVLTFIALVYPYPEKAKKEMMHVYYVEQKDVKVENEDPLST